jgi:hypothetical protein
MATAPPRGERSGFRTAPRRKELLVNHVGFLRSKLPTLLGVGALALGALMASAAPAGAAGTQTCTGDLSDLPASAGVLSGTYVGNVVVDGACAVDAGPAVIDGNLTLLLGSTLVAAFGGNGSRLTVKGNLDVQQGAALVLGCNTTSFTCLDDPSSDNPTLSSPAVVGGNLTATNALGVLVHNATIRGNVSETSGGGGVNCGPPDGPPPPGAFGIFGSPVYSTFEDTSIGGNLGVSNLGSCWLGLIRDRVGGNMTVTGDQLADPDAIEINDNTISGNLACQGNSMAWDSSDITDDLYPRAYEPNTVRGVRSGQCVVAPPLTQGGTSPGIF